MLIFEHVSFIDIDVIIVSSVRNDYNIRILRINNNSFSNIITGGCGPGKYVGRDGLHCLMCEEGKYSILDLNNHRQCLSVRCPLGSLARRRVKALTAVSSAPRRDTDGGEMVMLLAWIAAIIATAII